MSTQPVDESPRYFRCDDFAITMPVQECRDRRRSSRNQSETNGISGSEDRRLKRYMTSRCGECTAFRERIAQSISHEQMMERMNETPSVEAAPNERRAIYYGSLRTPHKDYGTWR